VGKEMFLA